MPYKDNKKQKEYQNNWMKHRRLLWIKNNGPCTHCGSWKNLQVDHINESEKASHRVWSWSEKRRNEELSKCQILCFQCHQTKTTKFLHKKVKHGTSTMYQAHKCRCALCKTWRRDRSREDRLKTKEKL